MSTTASCNVTKAGCLSLLAQPLFDSVIEAFDAQVHPHDSSKPVAV